MSRTNIVLDDRILDEALKLTQFKTKKELVNYALKELVQREKRKGVLQLEGKVEWIGNLEEMREGRV